MHAISIPSSTSVHTETLIVGGGIAGLSAANSLNSGTSFYAKWMTILAEPLGQLKWEATYSQGAHYDLSYPQNYGHEALELLEKMDVIAYDNTLNQFTFKDRQFIIPKRIKRSAIRKKGSKMLN